MKKDSQGRITNITKSDQPIKIKDNVRIYGGHSVCNNCGKDMPICWDTVCAVCGNTSCYECSYSKNGRWYCIKHKPKSFFGFNFFRWSSNYEKEIK